LNVAAIIQARMGSARLPGKVMFDLCGHSVLAHVVRRIQAAQGIGTVVVATTTLAADDAVAAEAERRGARVYRGSEHDVLSRYYEAGRREGADVVVRITADCPLIDPELVGSMVARFVSLKERNRVDYLSNTLERSFPRGLDAEVFSMAALERAWREAASAAEREHVTPYLYRHPELFRLGNHVDAHDRSRLRLTLDTPEDWAVIHAVVEALGGGSRIVSAHEVVQFLESHPQIAALNAAVEQKALRVD
jgi:spore coat polysaccharide biosynthesis protein SpsF